MRRTRTNPSAPEHPFVVLVRRFDPTGEELPRWEPLYRDDEGTTFFSEAMAKAAARRPPRDAGLHVGDLVAAVPVDALSDIDNQARALFVVTPDGIKAAPEMPEELDKGMAWTAAWEHNARAMLDVSGSVGRRRLVLAAYDCAETVLHLVPDGEDRPRIALETARAWCLGRATPDEVYRVAAAVTFAIHDAETATQVALTRAHGVHHAHRAASAAANAIRAAGAAIAVPAAYHAHASATYAARYAADASAYASARGWNQTAYYNAMRSMAPLVERWIPLPVLLLSRLGYPNAIPLNLDGVQSAQAPHSPTRSRQ